MRAYGVTEWHLDARVLNGQSPRRLHPEAVTAAFSPPSLASSREGTLLDTLCLGGRRERAHALQLPPGGAIACSLRILHAKEPSYFEKPFLPCETSHVQPIVAMANQGRRQGKPSPGGTPASRTARSSAPKQHNKTVIIHQDSAAPLGVEKPDSLRADKLSWLARRNPPHLQIPAVLEQRSRSENSPCPSGPTTRQEDVDDVEGDGEDSTVACRSHSSAPPPRLASTILITVHGHAVRSSEECGHSSHCHCNAAICSCRPPEFLQAPLTFQLPRTVYMYALSATQNMAAAAFQAGHIKRLTRLHPTLGIRG